MEVSGQRKAADSRVDVNSKGKVADWPKVITADTWSTYLQTWNKEKENFLSDWHKCKHLISSMTSEDKMTFGLFNDSDKIIFGLMQIYGSEADIVPAKIKEMRNLKPPKPDDYPHVQKNLHKLKLHIQYIEEQGESARLEANVVHEIVNTSLDPDPVSYTHLTLPTICSV